MNTTNCWHPVSGKMDPPDTKQQISNVYLHKALDKETITGLSLPFIWLMSKYYDCRNLESV